MDNPPQQPGWVEQRVRDQLAAALHRAVSDPGPNWEERAGSPDTARRSRPITFNAAMVRAILAGNKTQTRRPIKPAPPCFAQRNHRLWPTDEQGQFLECSLASRGEILWVREPWVQAGTIRGRPRIEFEADLGPAAARDRAPWRPGMLLPRECARLELQVGDIWPQRLCDLTAQDAIAEGVSPVLLEADAAAAIQEFTRLWDTFYGLTDYAWENNPWVWVVRFKSVEPRAEEG